MENLRLYLRQKVLIFGYYLIYSPGTFLTAFLQKEPL